MAKLGVNASDQKKRQFLNRLSSEITKRGIIDVLRNGVKAYPADLIMFYFTPTENNEKSKEMFEKNIFSVTRQLRYSSDATKLALDLCLFINGLPVITMELKNHFTGQTTADAVEQYKEDRSPQEHLERRVQLHLQSHEEMDREVKKESVSSIVFNFGYLPGGDHCISTKKESSLHAVSLALKLLMPEGVLLLTLYSGGDTGEDERNALLQWASQLDPSGYLVLKTDFFNRCNHPPVPMMIVKLRSQS